MLGGLIEKRIVRHFDWLLFLFGIAIPLFSLLVLFSAGYSPDSQFNAGFLPFVIPSQPFFRQGVFLFAGLLALLVTLSFSPQTMHRYAYLIYVVGLVLLCAVLAFGEIVNGSQRWIRIGGGLNLQPSELMKIGIILCLARYLSKTPPKDGAYRFGQLVVPMLLILVPAALIEKQPDLGSALVVAGVGIAMILFMGVQRKLILITLALSAVIAPLVWNNLRPYQQRRILTVINPEADPRGSGYHIAQSIIAVGSGELSGKGFMRGTQSQLEFLPEHTTDFIFSVLAEEWGFIGCIFLIILYGGLIYRLFRASGKSRDLFTSLVCFGVGALFSIHAIVNIGMVIGVLPVVGIPLAMFSYGGSALVTMLTCIGLVLAVGMRRSSFSPHGV